MQIQKRTPPGPVDLEEIAQAGADPLAGFLALERQFGGIVRIGEASSSWYLLTDPEYVKYVLLDNGPNYEKNLASSQSLTSLLGEGLLTSEGDAWQKQHRSIRSAFYHQNIAAQSDKIVHAVNLMLQRWDTYRKRSEVIKLETEFTRLTLEIVGRLFFNIDLGARGTWIGHALTTAADRFSALSIGAVAHPDEEGAPEKDPALSELVDEILAQGRSRPAGGDDLLSILLAMQASAEITERELREQILTILFTGETCSRVLAWTWYLLAGAPAIESRFRAELEKVIGDRDPQIVDLSRLGLGLHILQEAMRLFPPVWRFGRRPLQDDRIGGYDVPADSLIVLSSYVTHRLPRFWENPEEFEPDRFSSERSAGRPRFAYFPFGGGQRQCIGYHLALLESQLILAMVTKRFSLRLSPRHSIAVEPAFNLRSLGGIWVTLHEP